MSEESDTSSSGQRNSLKADLSFMNTLVSGPFTLLMTRMQCYPELVKQKLESSSSPRSGFAIAKTILKKEGLLAFWKGNLARILLSWTTSATMLPAAHLVVQFNPFSSWTKELVTLVVAGMTYPFKYAEIHLSNSTQPNFKTMKQSLSEGAAKGGIRNIYRGFLLHYVYCACLGPIGRRWQQWATLKMGDSQTAKFASTVNIFAVQTVNYGLTTVWKRMVMSSLNERPYQNTADCVMSMYREGGLASFYRGYSVFFVSYATLVVGIYALAFRLNQILVKYDKAE